MNNIRRLLAAVAAVTLASAPASAGEAPASTPPEEAPEPRAGPPAAATPAKPLPGLTFKAFLQLWGTAAQHDPRIDQAAINNLDGFRIRRARLLARYEHGPMALTLHLAAEHPAVLFDAAAQWRAQPWLQLTAGQFKLPLSASALTPALKVRIIDRPLYVDSMIKAAFRDVGVMLHSDEAGIFDGVLRYAAGVFNGGGLVFHFPFGNDNDNLLLAARVVLGTPEGLKLAGTKVVLRAGASYAHARYGPGATPQQLLFRLGARLGWADRGYRVTLAGADLTAEAGPVFLQAEGMRDELLAADGSRRIVLGGSVEGGLAVIKDRLEVVARYEVLNPSPGAAAAASARRTSVVLGLNYAHSKNLRVALNAGHNAEGDAAYSLQGPGPAQPAGPIDDDYLRLLLQYSI